MTNLQNELLKYRDEHHITQTELADLIGCKRSALSKWEIGTAIPKYETLLKTSKVLGVPVEVLLGDAPIEPKPALDPNVVDFAFFQQRGVTNDDQKKLIEDFIKMVTKKNG